MEEKQISGAAHSLPMVLAMQELRKNSRLCDVRLVVEGIHFPCHRVVLASYSDYFNAMFNSDLKEKDEAEVTMQEISATTMTMLLDFIYAQTISVTVSNVQELLSAACRLQLTDLKEACCTFLQLQLEAANCLGIWRFAESHGCWELQRAAEAFCRCNFTEVCLEEEFLSASLEQIVALVSSDHLQVDSEEPVFAATVSWVKHDEEHRKHLLPKLLENVRLPLLSAEYITDVVDNECLVNKDHACRDLLDEAKKYHLRPDLRITMTGPKTRKRAGTNECLFVLGGFGSNQNLSDMVEKFDPSTQTWSALPRMLRKRRYLCAAAMRNKLYIMGGYDGQSRLSVVECLDLSQPQPAWTKVASMHHRRGLSGACVYKDQIYVNGGFDGYSRHTSMERYDPDQDCWELLSPMGVGREGAGLVQLGGHLYTMGGYDGINLLDSAERYDLAHNCWSDIPRMATQRSGAGIAAVEDSIYVCGGYDGAEHLATVERFSVRTMQWTTVRPMLVPRCYACPFLIRGQLMLVAGYDGRFLLGSMEVYDPLTDTWSMLPTSLDKSRCDAGFATLRMP